MRLVLAGPLLYLGFFFLFPLFSILSRSIGGDRIFDLEPLRLLLTDSYYLGRIWFTLWQALISTVLTLAVGLLGAYLFARYEFPGKTLLKAFSTIPFVMPTVVVAMGFIALLGPHGLVNTVLVSIFNLDSPPLRINNTLTAIFLAHVFYNYSVVLRMVSAFWANLDPSLEETAKVLGAGRIKVFYHVTLPLLLPSIVSSALLVFTFSFTSFGVVLILGGSQFATLEVAIYELTTKLFRLPLAGALSIIQLCFTYMFLFLYTRLESRSVSTIDLKPRSARLSRGASIGDRILLGVMVLMLLLILSPLIALIERAFSTGQGYGIHHFTGLFLNERNSYFFLSPLTIVWNSIKFASVTVLISLIVGTTASYFLSRVDKKTGFFDALFMLPLGVSAVIMGYGFLISFNRSPIDLRDSWVILVTAHSLIAYPFVIRSILPVLRGMNPNIRSVALMLGASPLQTITYIDLPIISRTLLVGGIFAFAISMGEFGASLLLTRPEYTTMPVAIFRLLSQPGGEKFSEAMAMSSLLMGVVALGFIVIERFRYKNMGAF